MNLTLDRTIQPDLVEIGAVTIQEAKLSKLDNGIPVYYINSGFQELIKIELLFMNESFNASNPLLHSAANRMLSDGTAKYTAQQLADGVDYYGAFYETEENADYCTVNLYTLTKHLESTLPFLREMVTKAVFPESELGVYKQNNKQRLIVENEKVGSIARRKFNNILFGDVHPYGYFTTPDDFDKLNRTGLQAYHTKHYISDNCTIIVSGKVNDGTLSLINKYLGDAGWKGDSKSVSALPAMNYVGDKTQFIEKEGAVQSAIRIGRRLFNRNHPDYPGMAVLNTVLGGYFGSRLMSNIREDKGYTYGIGSALVSMKQEGYFFISTEVGADVTTPALTEIYKEIEILKNELVEEEELAMVRNYMRGTFIKGIESAFHLADRFRSIHIHGLGYDYYQNYLEKVRTIEPEEIRLLANKYLNSSEFYELVVGRK